MKMQQLYFILTGVYVTAPPRFSTFSISVGDCESLPQLMLKVTACVKRALRCCAQTRMAHAPLWNEQDTQTVVKHQENKFTLL